MPGNGNNVGAPTLMHMSLKASATSGFPDNTCRRLLFSPSSVADELSGACIAAIEIEQHRLPCLNHQATSCMWLGQASAPSQHSAI